ncbi:hypothetical protein EV421DRAFT_2041145 [Armillaria borealis]|uniref:Uncharacterized protein n=1 Tax=Armillaria borealis TaxID=47425 RepID=A0AA39IWA2_9AGAR|nr:hypothetical protein EV421DRAFT_2041145 [Armillaria borealis]
MCANRKKKHKIHDTFISLRGTAYNEFHLPVTGRISFIDFYSSLLNELTTASNPFIPRILVEDGQKLYPSVGTTGVEKLLFQLADELMNNIIHGDGALQLAYLVRLEDHPSESNAQAIKRTLRRNPLTFIVLSASTLASGRHISFSSNDIIIPENSDLDHVTRLFVPSEPLIQSSDASSYLHGLPELVTPFQTRCMAYCLPIESDKIQAIHVPMSLLHAAILKPDPELHSLHCVKAALRLTMLHEMTHRVLQDICRLPDVPPVKSIPWINSDIFNEARCDLPGGKDSDPLMEAGSVTEIRLTKGQTELVSTKDGQLHMGRVVSRKIVHEYLVQRNPHLGQLDLDKMPVILELLPAEEVRKYADGIFDFERESVSAELDGPTYVWHPRTAPPEVSRETGLEESPRPSLAPPRFHSSPKSEKLPDNIVWMPRLQQKKCVY